jgi:dTDP-4-dehydrorhamnose 3,5-epimerase
MNIIPLKIPEVLLITPEIFIDERGYFLESFNQKKFKKETGISKKFVQDNQSLSYKNVLRGLHYQKKPMEQGKLVRAVYGEILDVAVDIRKNSETYGKWVSEKLTADNQKQLWIPEGFAHGFLTLSEKAICAYKATNFYSSEHDKTLLWNDEDLNILWPYIETPIISKKDQLGIKFQDL